MEKFVNQEKVPNVNFLDERVKVSFEFENEAAEYLPEVSEEELKTGIEKYRILLGHVKHIDSKEVSVVISGIMEMEEHEKGFYEEGREAVSDINIPAIQKYVERVQVGSPEYSNFNLIGDVHTHPVLPKDFENGAHPWDPSQEDVDSIVSEYKSGVLTKEKPFIFAIAGPDENRETRYGFYRIVEKDGEYKVLSLD